MPCYCLLMLTCGKFADVIIFRPRGYIRHAEALLALGPDQHALEASQTVAKALAATKPGEDAAAHLRGWRMLWQPQLQALHVRTKAAACCWGAVKPNPASPDDALDDALQTLSRLIVAGLAIAKEPDVAMLAYGPKSRPTKCNMFFKTGYCESWMAWVGCTTTHAVRFLPCLLTCWRGTQC